jgi:hypothetical protein
MKETAIRNRGRSGTGWLIGVLTVTLITVQILIDVVMGSEAEYFNAHATLLQLTSWLHGRSPDVPLIAGQEQLGAWALPLATAVLFGVPLLVSTLMVTVWQRISGLLARRDR